MESISVYFRESAQLRKPQFNTRKKCVPYCINCNYRLQWHYDAISNSCLAFVVKLHTVLHRPQCQCAVTLLYDLLSTPYACNKTTNYTALIAGLVCVYYAAQFAIYAVLCSLATYCFALITVPGCEYTIIWSVCYGWEMWLHCVLNSNLLQCISSGKSFVLLFVQCGRSGTTNMRRATGDSGRMPTSVL